MSISSQQASPHSFAIINERKPWEFSSSPLIEIASHQSTHTVYIHYPDRAPLKEVLGGQYNYREGGGKCCGKALKAAGGVEVVDVIRIRAPKK